MRKQYYHFLTMLALVGAAACKEHSHGEPHAHHEATQSELRLDAGKKWQADAITRQTFAALAGDVSTAKLANAAAARNFSTIQEKRIADLFKGCTMTGAAHDQLHVLIGKTSTALQNLKSAEGEHVAHRLAELKATLALYPQYFD